MEFQLCLPLIISIHRIHVVDPRLSECTGRRRYIWLVIWFSLGIRFLEYLTISELLFYQFIILSSTCSNLQRTLYLMISVVRQKKLAIIGFVKLVQFMNLSPVCKYVTFIAF